MLSITRRALIKELLLEQKSVTVSALSKQYSVTEETIRRDLKALEEEGFLTRTYGGAFIQDGVINDISAQLRESAYTESKRTIAQLCSTLLHNGDTIFLDCSTTAAHLCDQLHSMRLTVITNSLIIANHLSPFEQIKLILVGGIYDPQYMAFVGKTALTALDSYYVDQAFLSCRSLSMAHGITDSNEHTAEIRQRLLDHAQQVTLIADYSKFDKTSFVQIGSFEDIDVLVTDRPLSSDWREFLSEKSIRMIDTAR